MKKKRLRLVTTIAILAALFGSGGGGTAWGQAYKNRYVTSNGRVELRRASQPGVIKQIDNAGDANNEFGAGESVTIKRNGSNEITMLFWLLPLRTFNWVAIRVRTSWFIRMVEMVMVLVGCLWHEPLQMVVVQIIMPAMLHP